MSEEDQSPVLPQLHFMLLAAKAEHQGLFAKSLRQVLLIGRILHAVIGCFCESSIFTCPIADPLTYVSKIAEKTGISGKTQGAAIQILREARRKRVAAGKDPLGLAAAALYIACLQHNEKKTQKNIAEAAGVTEVTVRNRYKVLMKQLNLELPDE